MEKSVDVQIAGPSAAVNAMSVCMGHAGMGGSTGSLRRPSVRPRRRQMGEGQAVGGGSPELGLRFVHKPEQVLLLWLPQEEPSFQGEAAATAPGPKGRAHTAGQARHGLARPSIQRDSGRRGAPAARAPCLG